MRTLLAGLIFFVAFAVLVVSIFPAFVLDLPAKVLDTTGDYETDAAWIRVAIGFSFYFWVAFLWFALLSH